MKTQYTFNCNTSEMTDRIKEWMYSPELKDIVYTFGGRMPDTFKDLRECASWLIEFLIANIP